MEHPLIVGVDGSSDCMQAVDWAADEAALHRIPLWIVHATHRETSGTASYVRPGTVQTDAEVILHRAARRAFLRHRSVKITSLHLNEIPARALLRASRGSFGLVVGRRGAGASRTTPMGSVSRAVATHAQSLVVVVGKARRPPNDHFHRVTVGADSATGNGPILGFAVREAGLRLAELEVVHSSRGLPVATDPSDQTLTSGRTEVDTALEDALREYNRFGDSVRVRRRIVEARPVDMLLEASKAADVIVVGTPFERMHPRGPHRGVTDVVLREAFCPVALVPSPRS